MSADVETPRSGGLIGSLRRLIDNVLGLFETRLELLSTDLSEERFQLIRMAVVALAVLFCFQAGIILAVLFLVLTAAAADRLALIGIAALVLLAMTLAGSILLWRWLRTRPPFFAATIAELKKDRDRLGRTK
jgi:uncharacterized membrane protein YqjE